MYLGIDIGGTTTRIGLFATLNEPDFSPLARFPTLPDYQDQIQAIFSAVRPHISQPLAGLGVSIGGRLAKDGRSVRGAPNLPSYVDQPFAHDLETQFGCPVRLAHDTVCGLVGEKCFGVVRDDDRCGYLTLSTGNGGAIYLRNGRQAFYVSIEFAHQLLDGNPLICLCGQVGCLETHTGGRQLEIRLGCSTEHITDPLFWQQFCDKLALGLVNLGQLTRIETLAVSGSIALHNPHLLSQIQEKVDEKLRGATLILRPALLQESAPLVGAAQLLMLADDAIVH